jgi:hypothetical protein
MTPGVYTFPGGHWYQRTSTSTPLAILALFSSYGRRGTFPETHTKVILQAARAENIFWQVADDVAIGVGADFAGLSSAKTDVLNWRFSQWPHLGTDGVLYTPDGDHAG